MPINTSPKHPEQVKRLYADYYIEAQAYTSRRVVLTEDGAIADEAQPITVLGDDDSYMLFNRQTEEPVAKIEAISLGQFIIQKLAATYAAYDYDQAAFESDVAANVENFMQASEYEEVDA